MSSASKSFSKDSLKPYIGTRDFFPAEMRLRNWLFTEQRRICKSYGYEEYSAPLLEPLELYHSKSSEEILSGQTYHLEDRGGRDVVIRPEMTPTLARMISLKKRELPLPVRWFSIANFMRYERPGRGRLREFFQLNADLLGAPGPAANAEILLLAVDILSAYGAAPHEFQVRYSDRRLFTSYLGSAEPERLREISRLLDKRAKLKEAEFEDKLKECCSDSKEKEHIRKFLGLQKEDLPALAAGGKIEKEAVEELNEMESILRKQPWVKEALVFDPSLVRGFDYYTGFIFEIYDRSPENNRSLLGGGRYDRLLGLLSGENIPAVGFGMGDITLENFLRSHGHIPSSLEDPRGVFLSIIEANLCEEHFQLAHELRSQGIEVEQMLIPTRKLGRQFELAQKKNRRFVIVLGEEELQTKQISIKDLVTGLQKKLPRNEVSGYIYSQKKSLL